MDLFQLVGTIAINNSEANSAIDDTTSHAESFGSKLQSGISTVAKWGTAIVGGATVAVTALAGVATSSASTADNIDKMSQKIGISREAYQELDFICSQSGTSVDNLQAGMKSLVSAMDGVQSGTASNIEEFEKLGVTVTNADGSLRSSEDVMWETLEALQGMDNETEKARLATELFGKSGTELLPLLNSESGSIEEMKQQAHDLGLVLDDELIDSGVELTDSLDQTKRAFSAIVTNLGGSLMPIVTKVSDYVQTALPTIQAMVERLSPIFTDMMDGLLPPLMDLAEQIFPVLMDLIEQILPYVTDIVQQILPVIVQLIQMLLPPIMQIVSEILPLLMELIDALLPVLQPILELLQPIIDLLMILIEPLIQLLNLILPPIITVITELINVFVDLLQPVLELIAMVIETVLDVAFENIIPIIQNVMEIMQTVWNTILTVIQTVVNAIREWITTNFNTIKTTISTICNAIWSGITTVFNSIKSTITTIVNTIKTGIVNGFTTAKDTALNVFNALKSGVETVFNGIWNVIKSIVNSILGGIETMCNGVIKGINKLLDGVEAVANAVGSVLGLNPVSLSLSEVSLPRLAKGGVLEKGQIGLLEGDGAEAVVPLEQNREWIAKVSNEFEAQGMGGSKEVLDALKEMIVLLTGINNNSDEFETSMEQALDKMQFKINNREFARLVKTC